jgi:hypothetical protein
MNSPLQIDVKVTVTAPRDGPYEPRTASAVTVSSTGATQWSKKRWCEVCGYSLSKYNQYPTCGLCFSICEAYHKGIRAEWANSASAAAPAAAPALATAADGRPDALEEAQILAAAAAAVKESNSQS